jgi:ribosome maturation factor RimP
MDVSQQIQQLASKSLEGSSHFVLSVKVIERLNPPRITVVLDGEDGITIDDCAKLSRALTQSIDEAALLEDYTLEVTTPGIDQPLKLARQYKKHTGRNLKIELKDKTVVRGKLVGMEGDNVVLEEETKQTGKKGEKNIRNINFELIDKTFVMISFK